MAAPGVLGGIGLASTALGGGVSAAGAIMGGEASAAQMRYQAGIARLNKKIALQNADYERAVGYVGAMRSGMASRTRAGNIKTAQASKGFDINIGSNVDVQDSDNLIARIDQRTIQDNASRRAYGQEVEAYKDESQANLYEIGADNAETAGQIGAISSILGASSSVASRWYQGRQSGMWSTT